MNFIINCRCVCLPSIIYISFPPILLDMFRMGAGASLPVWPKVERKLNLCRMREFMNAHTPLGKCLPYKQTEPNQQSRHTQKKTNRHTNQILFKISQFNVAEFVFNWMFKRIGRYEVWRYIEFRLFLSVSIKTRTFERNLVPSVVLYVYQAYKMLEFWTQCCSYGHFIYFYCFYEPDRCFSLPHKKNIQNGHFTSENGV